MLRILLIEDDPDVAAVTAAMLEYLGHHVTIASHGRDGLNIALQEQPEVVVTDFMMPVMSGLQMIESLREQGYAGAVVLCSAVNESMLPRHGAEYDAFVKKPFDLSVLMAAIDTASRKRGTRPR